MTGPGQSQWIVRRAVADDAIGLVRLARVSPAQEPPTSVQARISRLLEDPTRFIAVATADDGELIGVAEAQFYGVAMKRAVGSARLHDLFVVPAWRRRGVARSLFAQVRKWAEETPTCRYLEWQSSPAGLPFYEQMGLVGNEADDTDQFPFFEITV